MQTSNVTTVTIKAGTPNSSGEWVVDLTAGGMEGQLLYNNLIYNLVAEVVGKVGVEYSKFLLDNDKDRLTAEVNKIHEALQTGVVVK